MPDFIPGNDAQFQTWATTFSTYLTANAVALGLVAGDATTVATKLTTFNTALAADVAAIAAAKAATATKDAARADLEALLRSDAKRIQANPAVTNTQRTALGITVKDTTPTPAPVPVAIVTLTVDFSVAQEHRISFAKKPPATLGAEIWSSPPGATAEPTTDSGWIMLGLASNSPFVETYDASVIGKRIWYRARWTSTRHAPGPWGPVTSAVVGG